MKKSIEELVKKYSPEEWRYRIKKEMNELGLTFSNEITIKDTYESIFSNIVYFEFNNWLPGIHYPDDEPYITWLGDDSNIIFLDNEQWVKDNKLCVVWYIIDQSFNFLITATKEWVEQNCPTLLTKYTEFLRFPNENGKVYGRFPDIEFLPYDEKNIGITHK